MAGAHKNKKTGVETPPSSVFPKWIPVAVIIITGFIYLKATQNGITNLDDDFYVLNNKYIRDFSWQGVWAIFTSFYSYNYHPLTTLTYLLEYRLFELNPISYHLINVVLHLVNTWLVFKFTYKLSNKHTVSVVTGTLFALHPMHVESVAWISERKDVLYSFFYLLSLISYLKYLNADKKRNYYLQSLLFFILSLLSKSAAVTLPVLLLVLDLYRNRKLNISVIVEKLPFFALSLLFGILAILSQKMGGAITDITVTYGIFNRINLFFAGLASYVVMFAFPVGLSAIHFFPNTLNNIIPWHYYLSLPFLCILTWLLFRESKMKKEHFFGGAFFLISISVMLQFITVGAALFAERYTYLSYIGLFYIAGQWMQEFEKNKINNILITIFVVVALIFSYQTFNRIDAWKDTDTIFEDIISNNPSNKHNSYIYWYWGTVKTADGNTKDALQCYTNAILADSTNEKAYANRGMLFESRSDFKSAVSDYDRAIKFKPDAAKDYNLRGWAYFQSGNNNAALQDLNRALKLDSAYAEAFNNRGWIYYKKGVSDSAIADFSHAIRIDRKSLKPYFNKAAVYADSGKFDMAMIQYDSLLKYHPMDSLAYFNRGILKTYLKDTFGACVDWHKALQYGNKGVAPLIQMFCK